MKTRHGACGRTWTQRGERTSHCAGCCETYATLSLFDAHRIGPWSDRRCVIPDGLVQDDEGVWWTPEGLANNVRQRVAGAEAIRHARSGLRGPARTPENAFRVLREGSGGSEPSESQYADPEETPR